MELQGALWATLLGSMTVYWLLPRGRDWFLIGASLAYVAYAASQDHTFFVVPMVVVWSLLYFYVGKKAEGFTRRARMVRSLLILAILAYLAYFKYFPAILSEYFPDSRAAEHFGGMALPLGISYLTFKAIHYLIDLSHRQLKEHSAKELLLYLAFFPIFPAGPIERFDHFLKNRQTKWDWNLLATGGRRIIFGLIKKFVFADLFLLPFVTGVPTGEMLQEITAIPVFMAWMHVMVWFLYFYLDFAAYSDIAIGGSRLFGFEIMENFNFPVMATNIGEFWQRWHMSLAQWCRAYIYMPMLGLTRKPTLAIYATMLTIAIWHTANLAWICWGLYHATGLLVFRYWQLLKRRWGMTKPTTNPLVLTSARVLTLAFVSGSYCFLVTQKLGVYAGVRLFCKLFGFNLPA